MIYPEKSESWAARVAGQIPQHIDLFCLACIDRDSERFTRWGYYESTVETMEAWRSKFPRSDMFVVASVRVPVKGRDQASLTEAAKEGKVLMDRTVWQSQEPGFIAFRNKLAEDLTYWKEHSAGPAGLTVERVDGREFEELLKGHKLVS